MNFTQGMPIRSYRLIRRCLHFVTCLYSLSEIIRCVWYMSVCVWNVFKVEMFLLFSYKRGRDVKDRRKEGFGRKVEKGHGGKVEWRIVRVICLEWLCNSVILQLTLECVLRILKEKIQQPMKKIVSVYPGTQGLWRAFFLLSRRGIWTIAKLKWDEVFFCHLYLEVALECYQEGMANINCSLIIALLVHLPKSFRSSKRKQETFELELYWNLQRPI